MSIESKMNDLFFVKQKVFNINEDGGDDKPEHYPKIYEVLSYLWDYD